MFLLSPLALVPVLVLLISTVVPSFCASRTLEVELSEFHVTSSLHDNGEGSSWPLFEFWALSSRSRLQSARLPTFVRLKRLVEVEKGADGRYVAINKTGLALRNSSWTLHPSERIQLGNNEIAYVMRMEHGPIYALGSSSPVARGLSLLIERSLNESVAVVLELALTGPNGRSEGAQDDSEQNCIRTDEAFVCLALNETRTFGRFNSSSSTSSSNGVDSTVLMQDDGALWLVMQRFPEKASLHLALSAGLHHHWPLAAIVALAVLGVGFLALVIGSVGVWIMRRMRAKQTFKLVH